MNSDRLMRVAVLLAAAFLGVIALRPYVSPTAAHAQGQDLYPLYIEPSVHNIRAPDGSGEFLGKVVVDMRNGNIWGFPTGSKAPFPVRITTSEPPVSHPIYLGKFDFAGLNKKASQ
jgi:hypothetical protein